jgi:cytidine kinase
LIDFVAFGIILDDIVFPDGRTQMGVLGGGGPQAAFGMRIWSPSVGLVSGAGPDLPESVRDWLALSDIDPQGLRITEAPTLRAWQVFEASGERTQVWRVPLDAVRTQLERRLDFLPLAFQKAQGYHYGIHPNQPDLNFARTLGSLGGKVSIEPFKPAEELPSEADLEGLFEACDVFSPNLLEAASLVGPGEPVELLQSLLLAGADLVALRLGAAGSLVARRGEDRFLHIPPLPVEVIDPTGAGNAYCGGLLAAWLETGDLAEAGLRAAVSASFLLEQVGIPVIDRSLQKEAVRRLNRLRKDYKTSY